MLMLIKFKRRAHKKLQQAGGNGGAGADGLVIHHLTEPPREGFGLLL